MNPRLNGHGGQVHTLAARLGVAPEAILDFSASINPLGPPPEVLAWLRDHLSFLLRNYPLAKAEGLKEALAEKMGLGPENILVGNGSTELIHLLPRLADRGRALIVEPAFSEYRSALTAAGWRVDHHVCLMPEDLSSLTARDLTVYKLIYLGRPTNPGGWLPDDDHVAKLLGRLGPQGWVVLDEAFIDFCPRPSLAGLVAQGARLVIIGSLTKFYAMPGLRLGYLSGQKEVIDQLHPFLPPWTVNALAQEAGRLCLNASEFAQASRSFIEAARRDLAEALARLGISVFPAQANYLLLRLDRPAEDVIRALADRAILVRSCANFTGLGPNYLRVSVRLPEENRRLAARLGEALAGFSAP